MWLSLSSLISKPIENPLHKKWRFPLWISSANKEIFLEENAKKFLQSLKPILYFPTNVPKKKVLKQTSNIIKIKHEEKPLFLKNLLVWKSSPFHLSSCSSCFHTTYPTDAWLRINIEFNIELIKAMLYIRKLN